MVLGGAMNMGMIPNGQIATKPQYALAAATYRGSGGVF